MIRLIVLMLVLWCGGASAETLKLAVTTSFHNSGLSDVLLPAIKADTGITVQLLVVGTGQALRLGRAGDVDAILVHSRAAEESFVSEGFGTHRREIMYNDFVFIGPDDDPAGISAAATASVVLNAIAGAHAPFVSRGDDSGTHQREMALWEATSIAPDGTWYRPVGAGMGAALNTAAAMDAYILADRASWLNFGNKANLSILFSGDPALFNQYAYVPVSPSRHSHVRTDLAQQLEVWLTSQRAANLINGYMISDEVLFTFNAESRP
jgi:tungstate transport system substrate-binding protein